MASIADILSAVKISDVYRALTGAEPRHTGRDTLAGAALDTRDALRNIIPRLDRAIAAADTSVLLEGARPGHSAGGSAPGGPEASGFGSPSEYAAGARGYGVALRWVRGGGKIPATGTEGAMGTESGIASNETLSSIVA